MKTPMGVMNGIQYVAGVGFVQDNGGQVGALGDDAAVMMISGLGDDVTKGPVAQSQGISVVTGTIDHLKLTLKEPYTFFGIKLPLWLWLLVAAGAVGAGAIFFNKKYFKL